MSGFVEAGYSVITVSLGGYTVYLLNRCQRSKRRLQQLGIEEKAER
jgi:hypothetical protein